MPGPGITRVRTDSGFGGFAPRPAFVSGGTKGSERVKPKYGTTGGEFEGGDLGDHNFDPGFTPLPGNVGRGSPPRVRDTGYNSVGPGAFRGGGDLHYGGGSGTGPKFAPDPSGAGLTPSGLTGNTLRSFPNAPWTPDTGAGAFADRGVSGGAEAQPTIASRGGRPPTFVTDPNADWTGAATSTEGWAQSDTGLPGIGGNGTERTADLPSEPGVSDEPLLFANLDAENPAGTQQTNEWTTSPGDRRFLPSPSTDPRYMANFGGNMTIGQFLNTPLALMRFGGGYPTAVGGANVSYANTGYTLPPVAGMSDLNAPSTPEAERNFAAAERRGAEETATAQRSGQLPASGEVRTWTAGTGTPHINVATGQVELNRSGSGHNAAAHAAMLYNMSQAAPSWSPFAAPDELGYTDEEGTRHMNRFATAAERAAAFARFGPNRSRRDQTLSAAQVNVMRKRSTWG